MSIVGHLDCQSFRQGCCGCCVNMRWSDSRIMKFLGANTECARRIFRTGQRIRFRDLVRLHLMRGGWVDHLLGFWLVPFTFGISAWVWKRWLGSCVFAGIIEPETGRVGCLIHPEIWGGADLRKHAFPMIPTLGCNRALRCGMLREGGVDLEAGFLDVSRRGWRGR